jgi:hypothetical protein
VTNAKRISVEEHGSLWWKGREDTETKYDELLAGGFDRQEARGDVEAAVHGVLEKWLGD